MANFEDDPQRDREAERYERPIPSREFILDFLREHTNAPVDEEFVANGLEMEDEEQRTALNRRLRAMERDGQLIRTRRNLYGLPERMDLVRGKVTAHPDGFGFLVPEDRDQKDLFLSPREMRQVMHGDRVVARLVGFDKRGRPEGAVVRIVERGQERVVGRLDEEDGIHFVVPDEKRLTQNILVPPGEDGGAKLGEIVSLEIIHYPTPKKQPTGRVIEIVGEHLTPEVEVEIVMRKHGIPHTWPDEVLTEAEKVPQSVSPEDIGDREDLRALPLVTIDGADARDFDDAVFAERAGDGFRLIVAIADVSSYVKPNASLDKEGYHRGNSTYFPQRVVPMLPEALSNGICSLNPGVDRLTLACEMHVTSDGEVDQYRFFEAVMHSHARLTYSQVAAMMEDGDEAVREEYSHLLPQLETLYELYRTLHKARVERGAIEFEGLETQIVFGENNQIEMIVPYERRDAHRLIEECMLAANESAARLFADKKEPALFRVHEPPAEEKLENLRDFLKTIGLDLGPEDPPTPKSFGRVLEEARGRRDGHLIETVMLRSMQQAQYRPDNQGHFGLSYDHYTHFTSPIRRYPDLVVHRRIKDILAGRRVKEGKKEAFKANLAEIGEHTSATERRSELAERETVDWLKCQYMQEHLGEEYDAVIAGVTGFGVFAELTGVYVEGLVHITNLEDDYYHFDPVHHLLRGERTGRIYQLGDPLRVKVARVDVDDLKIDLGLVKSPAEMGAHQEEAEPSTADD
ncbi:ribonuclease R [Thiohalorhabdus methylotrophus]|uniref:Ribonuclease R n=1 Tax=Thiohalorhabdus methylotrophus TaxID=3242694 RepID=A0ABV4TYB6_9GAMM